MTPKVAMSERGTAMLGMIVARALRRKKSGHHDDQHDTEDQIELYLADRGANGGGPIAQHGELDPRGETALQLGSSCSMSSTTAMTLAPG